MNAPPVPRIIPEAVLRLQIAASDPALSAWVAANAGAGKTHVLAQRVIRLLLDGVDPGKILCITFTKAAAANMANRVFDDLRAWTVLDDAALDEAMRKTGVAPQLTLEAAILRHGGFSGIAAGGSVAELAYVSLKGGTPAGENKPIEFKEGDADAHAERALAKLTEVALKFEDEEQPYLPLVLSMWKSRYGTYDHLARVKEWSVGGDDEDMEAGGSE